MSLNRSALVVVAMTGPRVAQDDVGQERGLEGPRRRHHQDVLFERDAQPVPVVGAAQEDRVLARVQDPVAQREGGADPARAAQRREAAPAQVQAEEVGEALAGVQPQVQPDPQVAGAVAGQVTGGQERPRGERGQDQHDGQHDGVLDDHRGSPFCAARTALRRAARAAPGCRPSEGGEFGADPGHGVERDRGERPVPFGGQVQEPGGLGRLPRDRPPPPARAGPGRRRRGAGAAAGGDRALLQHPGAEPGQGGGRGQGQAQQPQGQAAEDGQRGGRVGGQGRAQLLVAGDRPGPDDADQGVAGQGVGDRRQGPDGQVPPAGRGGEDVHEHAGADGGQVQRPGPQRAAAVQGQRDAQAGEDQGGGVRDRRLQGGDDGEVAGGVDHPVLGGEADRGGGRGQDAEPGGGVAQPQAGVVRRPSGRGGLAAVAGRADQRQDGRTGPGQLLARCRRRPVMSGPVPVPGRVKGIERVMADRFLGRRGTMGCRRRRCGRRLRAGGG